DGVVARAVESGARQQHSRAITLRESPLFHVPVPLLCGGYVRKPGATACAAVIRQCLSGLPTGWSWHSRNASCAPSLPRRRFSAAIYLVPQLLVGVPCSAQQVSVDDAQTPLLHHEVTALRPDTLQAQQVGRHSVGSVQVLPAGALPKTVRSAA